MERQSPPAIDQLPSARLEDVRLTFTLRCKNSGQDHAYDLTERQADYPDILTAFAAAIFARRDSVEHKQRSMCKYAIKRFLTYLDTLRGTDAAVTSVAELTEATFSRYAAWLKAYGTVTYQSKLRLVKTLRPMVDWIRRNHPAGHAQLRVEANLFPHAGLIRKTRKPYTKGEWDALLRAIAEDLAADKARLERPYIPKWKGEPPPLEEVASYRVGNSHHNEHSIWASREYQIWWWENITNCQTLSSYRLQAIGGGSLVNHLKRERKERRAATGAPYRLSAVNEFYESIGAGPNYEPRYLGKPCPIKYRNRFRKPEYVAYVPPNRVGRRSQRRMPLRCPDSRPGVR